MRSFWISVALFVLLIAVIIGNAVYVHHVTEEILARLSHLTAESDEREMAALEAYWEKHRAFVALSISYQELDHLSESLISLRATYDTGNAIDFELYRQICRDASRELARLERFSLENLF